jgi:hypothetical protein
LGQNRPTFFERNYSQNYNIDPRLSHADNGTYLCHGVNDRGTAVGVMEAVVYDKPEVKLDVVEAIGSSKIFFNWTVIDWNSPVTDYFLSVSRIWVPVIVTRGLERPFRKSI